MKSKKKENILENKTFLLVIIFIVGIGIVIATNYLGNQITGKASLDGAKPNTYKLSVGQTKTILEHTVTLENVGSSGAIVINVNDVTETIGKGTSECVEGLDIGASKIFYDDLVAKRSAVLLIKTCNTLITCTDSDTTTENNGIDATIRGSISWTSPEGKTRTKQDQCVGNILAEWYCNKEFLGRVQEIKCSEGCNEGVCVAGICTADVRLCSDGKTYVGRDPEHNCEFKSCSGGGSGGGGGGTASCGNNVCEPGEANIAECPACEPEGSCPPCSITIGTCPQDCEKNKENDLSCYPHHFIKSELVSNMAIVIGKHAPASDTLAAVDLHNDLQQSLQDQCTSLVPVIPPITYIDEEITTPEQYNLLIISTNNLNSLQAQYERHSAFKYGSIQVADNGNNIAILVLGRQAIDTRMAAKALTSWKTQKLKGHVICTNQKGKLIPCPA